MDGQVSYTTCSQLKRESIVRLLTVSKKNANAPGTEQAAAAASASRTRDGAHQHKQPDEADDDSDSLVLVSAKGRVAVYDASLKLAVSFTLSLSSASVAGAPLTPAGEEATGGTSAGQPAGQATSATKSLYKGVVPQKAKHLNGWITDCVHMDDSTLVVASSERCLHFFTTAATPYVERFRMDGMKDIPTALAYLAPGGGRTEPLLGVGDDGGDVFVLRFLKSSQALFKKREVEREIQHVYWRELHLQAGMVTLTVLPGSHRSPVMQVDLKRAMQRVISCSKNSFTSLAIRHIRQEASTSALPSVVLRNASGVACFDYDDEKGLIVTGSSDGKIRLWSPTHLAKPWMVIAGHSSLIAGVLLVEQSAFLWSVCDQSELRYWDLDDGTCLKNIQLSFKRPSGSSVKYGLRPLLALDSALYVACGDSIASVPLKRPLVKTSVHMWQESKGLSAGSTEAEGTQKDAESKIPHRYREGLLDFGYRTEDEVFRKFLTDLQGVFSESTTVTQQLKEIERAETLVDGIEVEPIPGDGDTYDWEVEFDAKIPPPTDLVPLNQVKLKELEGVNQMRKHVKDGIPFCGLRLLEPQQCELPKGLPITSKMKKQGIMSFETLEEVRSANFDLFSERMVCLSSAQTSIASSILSYYRHKKVSEKVMMAGDNELLVVSRSQQSSRKSSIVSVSALSSAPSIDNS